MVREDGLVGVWEGKGYEGSPAAKRRKKKSKKKGWKRRKKKVFATYIYFVGNFLRFAHLRAGSHTVDTNEHGSGRGITLDSPHGHENFPFEMQKEKRSARGLEKVHRRVFGSYVVAQAKVVTCLLCFFFFCSSLLHLAANPKFCVLSRLRKRESNGVGMREEHARQSTVKAAEGGCPGKVCSSLPGVGFEVRKVEQFLDKVRKIVKTEVFVRNPVMLHIYIKRLFQWSTGFE